MVRKKIHEMCVVKLGVFTRDSIRDRGKMFISLTSFLSNFYFRVTKPVLNLNFVITYQNDFLLFCLV